MARHLVEQQREAAARAAQRAIARPKPPEDSDLTETLVATFSPARALQDRLDAAYAPIEPASPADIGLSPRTRLAGLAIATFFAVWIAGILLYASL
ncbi:MAG: hypothetical protein AAGJ29_08840 [Pseudomonadota bacterium]